LSRADKDEEEEEEATPPDDLPSSSGPAPAAAGRAKVVEAAYSTTVVDACNFSLRLYVVRGGLRNRGGKCENCENGVRLKNVFYYTPSLVFSLPPSIPH
jgi:hypothetical protein